MAELGASSDADHRAMAAHAAALGIEVISVATPAYGSGVQHVIDVETAVGVLGELGPEAAVLVKGSRVAGLEQLVVRLIAEGGLQQQTGGGEPVE